MFACTQVALENIFAVVSSAKVIPKLTWAAFSSAQVAPEHPCAAFSNAQVASAHAPAAFSSAQVASAHASAAFSSAQAAPEHACAGFIKFSREEKGSQASERPGPLTEIYVWMHTCVSGKNNPFGDI